MSETLSDGPQQPKRARQRKILFVLSGLVGVLIVVAVIVVVTRPSPATTARPPAPTTRGILNLVSWWNQNHKPVPVTECIRDGETPFGTERAWELESNAIACYDDVPGDSWQHKMTYVDIYFPGKATESQAIAIARSVLPADAESIGTYDGVNTTPSPGTCRNFVYTSPTLAAAVHQTSPKWTTDPSNATIILYSGHNDAQAGSDTTYSPNSVNVASVAIGAEDHGPDGETYC